MNGSQILAILLSAAASFIGLLVLWNLRVLKHCITESNKRIDKHDDEIKRLQKSYSLCKIDCQRTNVSKEDWVREAGLTRKRLDDVADSLSRIDGKFTIVEKLPQICSNIAGEIVKQMQGAN